MPRTYSTTQSLESRQSPVISPTLAPRSNASSRRHSQPAAGHMVTLSIEVFSRCSFASNLDFNYLQQTF